MFWFLSFIYDYSAYCLVVGYVVLFLSFLMNKCDGGNDDDDDGSQKYSSDLDTPSVCRNKLRDHNFTIELHSIMLDILTVNVKKYSEENKNRKNKSALFS